MLHVLKSVKSKTMIGVESSDVQLPLWYLNLFVAGIHGLPKPIQSIRVPLEGNTQGGDKSNCGAMISRESHSDQHHQY